MSGISVRFLRAEITKKVKPVKYGADTMFDALCPPQRGLASKNLRT
jgi:hypothetical protein